MNLNIKLFLLLLFFSSIHITSIAQERNLSISPTIGLNVPILDNGIGFHVGLNPAYSISNRFAIEAQISFAYVKINGSFISGEENTQSNFNALLGGRLYVLSEEKKARPYLNLLIGGMQNQESDYIEFVVGVSTGVFVDINRFLVGLSVETPGNFILKAGYTF